MIDPSDIADHIFGGYDISGLVNKDLDIEVLTFLGQGYGTYLSKRRIKETVVGRDNRLSSDEYEKGFIYGLRKTGINVIDFGLGLSPMMYFSQYLYRTQGGAFITASHNPKEYNGIKLAVGFSQLMMTDEIKYFKSIVKSGDYTKSEREGSYKLVDVSSEYKKDLHSKIDLTKKFRVVIDTCNGTAGMFYPDILRSFGCEVIEQNTKLDGNFPSGNPNPTEKSVQERVASRVLIEKADIGFLYDTDGDRLGVVDERGNLIWNDSLVSIFANDILDFLPGSKIIFNNLCSKQVPESIRSMGGEPIIWRTGHSYIMAKVSEERAPFGGELSGHFFFNDNFYGHDDGMFSSLRLLSYLARKNISLGEAVKSLPQYISSPEIKLGCSDEVKFDLIRDEIAMSLKKLYPSAEFNEIDGIRLDTEYTMIVARASQNTPFITIKFEAKTKEEYDKIKAVLSAILHKYPEIDFFSGVNTEILE